MWDNCSYLKRKGDKQKVIRIGCTSPWTRHIIFIPSFIHSVVCLMTGAWPLPKRVLHRVRSSVSSFIAQYARVSLRSPSSCLRLLSPPSVTSITHSIFSSITCFRRQFLHKMQQIQLTYFLFISVGCSSPPWLYIILHFFHICPTDLLHVSQEPHFKLPRHFWSTFYSVQVLES